MKNHLILLILIVLASAAGACSKNADGSNNLKIVPYRDGDLWGFAKPNGTIVVKPQYTYAYLYEDGFGRTGSGELTGLVSPEGKVLIEPKYSYISDFKHGRAVFSTPEGKLGYLDEQGNEVIPAQYDQALTFRKDYAAVQKDSQYQLIRHDGSAIASLGTLMPIDYDPSVMYPPAAQESDPGYILVIEPQNYRMGLIDLQGKTVIAPAYQSLSLPVNGVIIANKDDQYTLLRTDGNTVGNAAYANLFRLDADRIQAQKADNTLGIINNKGETVIPFEYSSLYKGPGDTFIAYKNDSAGLIDAQGNMLIPFAYNYLFARQNYLMATNSASQMGVITTNNQILLPFEYDNIEPLGPNRFLVDKGGKRGLIDEKGKALLPIEYDLNYLETEAHEYVEGLDRPVTAIVLFKGMKGTLFNTDGKKISDKNWLYAAYPDALGLTYAADANGRETVIGPDGAIYAKDPALKKVTVNSAQALFDAIANDTEITLEDGQYDLGAVQGSNEFAGIYDFAEYNMEDRTIVIRNVRNLHIKAKNPGKVQLVTSFVFVPVLRLEECKNVSLTGLSVGHEVEPGLCEGAVLTPVNCSYFVVENCDLYGSGTFGIEADGCSYVGLFNSVIRECTRGIMYLNNSYSMFFENCTMKDNGGDHMVHVTASNTIHFDGVTFTNNHTPVEYGPFEFFRLQDVYQAVNLRNSTFNNCSADYFATYAEGITETGVNRKGFAATKGLWKQKEPHITRYDEAEAAPATEE